MNFRHFVLFCSVSSFHEKCELSFTSGIDAKMVCLQR